MRTPSRQLGALTGLLLVSVWACRTPSKPTAVDSAASPLPATAEARPALDTASTAGSIPPQDVDSDGFLVEDGDCDDTDPRTYPGAYDRPNDGRDQDCSGADRAFDGVVLSPGEAARLSWVYVASPHRGAVDLVVLLAVSDTLPDPTDTVLPGLRAAVSDLRATEADVRLAVAQVDDYGARPLTVVHPLTWSPPAASLPVTPRPVERVALLEAFVQLARSPGHDLDCDGVFDEETDLVDAASTRFGGPTPTPERLAGTGSESLLGLRPDARSVWVVWTDVPARDADAGHAVPAACPEPPAFDDTLAALADAQPAIVPAAPALPRGGELSDQWSVLSYWHPAEDAGSDPVTLEGAATTDPARLAQRLSQAIEPGLAAEPSVWPHARALTLAVETDPSGLVTDSAVRPSRDWSGESEPEVAWEVTLTAPAASTGLPRQTTVVVDLLGDGTGLDRQGIDVELAPY